MKKISLLTLGAIFAMNVSAQDLGVKTIIVQSKVDTSWTNITNDTLLTNDTLYLGVLFENQAGGFVNNTDSIAFGITINGVPAGIYGAMVGGGGVPSTVGANTIEMIIKITARVRC